MEYKVPTVKLLLAEPKFYCNILDKFKYNGKSISKGTKLNFRLCHYYKLIYLLNLSNYEIVNICMEYAWHDKKNCTILVITYFIEEPLGYFNIQISWIFSSNNVRLIFVQALAPLTEDIIVKLLPCNNGKILLKHSQKESFYRLEFYSDTMYFHKWCHFLKYGT